GGGLPGEGRAATASVAALHTGQRATRGRWPMIRRLLARPADRARFSWRSALRGGAVLLAVVVLGGCGRGVYDMPLPGGADVGDDPYEVKVRFADVLDLVPNAGVRVNNVPVGRVKTVDLADDEWEAEVTVVLNGDVHLPANAVARLRQSSLLGEKYVELSAPPASEQPVGTLSDGDLITAERTGRSPEVEEVLGALSMLLNGGGVAQGENIGTALRDIEPGLQVLNEQREQLVTMLRSLDELSAVATDVVNQSKDDLVHNINQLAPTLHQLAAAGENLPKSLEVLL